MRDTRFGIDKLLWDQLTLFGPLPSKPEPAIPLQLELHDNKRQNAASIETADLIAELRG